MRLSGGSWCFVSPGTCTTLPSKSSTNTSLGEEFDSGWDYCTDPAYDQERASELASMTDSYIMIAKYRHINHTTQAGCQCSPIDWTHYPADGSPGVVLDLWSSISDTIFILISPFP